LVCTLRSWLTSGDHATEAKSEEGEERDGATPIAEMRHEEVLEMIQGTQDENDTLHESMEEAIQLASGMNAKMAGFDKVHNKSSSQDIVVSRLQLELKGEVLSKGALSSKIEVLVKENEKLSTELVEANSLVVSSVRDEIKQEQLSKNTWLREKRELSSAMDGLKKENENLHESMKEMNNLVTTAEECVTKLDKENTNLVGTQEYYVQQVQELKVEKDANACLRAEIKSVSAEREEAYDTCKVLQQEINVLHISVKDSKEQIERLHSDGSIASGQDNNQEKKSAELTRLNESLLKDLGVNSEALQAVQSALENLKDEQATIKETIVALRVENSNLRDVPITPQSPMPKPSSKQSKSSHHQRGDGSDSSQILKLEARITKVAKENKGLRDANSKLSIKLFDEMEKTDALRVANEGLAARICKLVAFIQQTPGGGGLVPSGSGGSKSSSSGGTSSKRSKSPAPPKRKK